MTWGAEIMQKREKIERISDAKYVTSKIPKLKGAALFQHYNKKLYLYWLSELCDEIPDHKKKIALKVLLGRR